MPSQTDIANMALQAIGTRSSIQSFNEDSVEANAISLRYDSVRKELLRAVHWNFARKQAYLSLLIDGTLGGSNPIPPPPWLYEYAVPSDSVKLRYLMPQFQNVPGASVPGIVTMPAYVGPPVRFITAQDVDHTNNTIPVVLTNQNQAIAVYTKDETNTDIFDPSFVEAFALLLGAKICRTLTGDKSTTQQLFKEAENMVAQARADNGNEGLTVHEHMPEWMRVRGYASDWAFPDGGMYFYGPQALTLIA